MISLKYFPVRLLSQLKNNWHVALRLSWFWIIATAAFYYFESLILEQFFGIVGITNLADSTTLKVQWAYAFIGGTIIYVGCLSIAIGWHRFMINNEQPPSLHIINFDWPIAYYLGTSFVLGILLLLLGVLLSMLFLGIILPGIDTTDLPPERTQWQTLFDLLARVCFEAPVIWLGLRLGLVLPAVAVRKDLRFGESFELTKQYRVDLIVTALLIHTLQAFVVYLQNFIWAMGFSDSYGTNLGWLALNEIFFWISLFVGFGVLTVLFQELVPKNGE